MIKIFKAKGVFNMVILDNGTVHEEIAEMGAEIRRLTVNGEERMWNGDEKFWTGVAPVLFPICGGIPDNKFELNGKEYDLVKHGFARKSLFTVEKASNTTATFLLKSNEETLKSYPWEFEFRVKYTLSASMVNVEYDVLNLSDSLMYTAVGGHEAYLCEGGIENYDVIFEREETLKTHRLEGTLISRKTDTILYESKVLPLYTEYFEIDALIFTDVKSRFVTLRNRTNGKSVSVNFDGFDFLLLWTKPGAPYLCIEPWTTSPSYLDDSHDLSLKEGMTAVEPGKHFTKTHKIYF